MPHALGRQYNGVSKHSGLSSVSRSTALATPARLS